LASRNRFGIWRLARSRSREGRFPLCFSC
jgi:hypothetical protein